MKKITLFLSLFIVPLLVILFLFSGLGTATAANPAKDARPEALLAPFNLTSHTPVTHAIGVAVDTDIIATFDADVATASVVSTSFAAHTQFGGLLTGTLSVAGDTITLNPNRDLFAGERVQVIATANLSSTGGMNLTNPTQWGFTAGPITNRCVDTFADSGTVDDALLGVWLSSVAWGDYDNDGDLDILLTGRSSGFDEVAKVYRNDAGTFVDSGAADDALRAVSTSSVTWGDYDNDGDLDILLTGAGYGNNPVTKVYRNDAGTFVDSGAADDALITVESSSVAWGDYDNDGDLDILLTGRDSGGGGNPVSKVYRNDAGTFVDSGAADDALLAVVYSSVAWEDYDNDGDLDILLTGEVSFGNRVAKVYRNDAGTFVDSGAADDALIGVRYSSVAWGDYDNDGDLDILLTGEDSGNNRVAKVYRNDAGTFVDSGAADDALTAVVYSSVAWGDTDNDGDLDILLTGEDGSNRVAKVYRNEDCPPPDLQLTKSVAPIVASPGDTITYTLAFTNTGSLLATQPITITDNLPPEFVVTHIISSGVGITQMNIGNAYQWQVGDLDIGEGGIITIAGTLVPTATTFTNTATITNPADADPNNNTSSATVTIPSQYCNLQQGNNYVFYEATVPVSVTVNTVGDMHCLSIIRVDTTHLNATANMTDSRYWVITGTTNSGQPITTYNVDLTFPHAGGINPLACRYPGGLGGLNWDCTGTQMDNGTTVTRQNVTQFSDWAIGYNVGPTAVSLQAITVTQSGYGIWLGLLVGLLLMGSVIAWRRP